VSGFVVWFTGLSGAGKSTLGSLLASALRGRGVHVEVLDGDEVRTHLSKGLTFSREDRNTNIRRIGFVAKLLARSGACAITAAISPFRAIRDEQRAQIDKFVEVYCQSSIEALAARDPKGLYRKALAGEIKGFTGIDDPYEEPLQPEVVVYTDRESKEESLAKIIGKLEELGYISSRAGVSIANRANRANRASKLPKPHGGALVSARLTGEKAEESSRKAQSMSFIDLDAEAEVDLESLASGAYSPLEGFVTSKDWLRIFAEMRLENGLPWPVPISLPVSEEIAANLRLGNEVALRNRSGRIVGTLEISDVYCPEELLRGRTIVGPFGAEDPEMLRQMKRSRFFVGGKVRVFAESALPSKTWSPAETRKQFDSLGLRYVAALRTTGSSRSAEEYMARVAIDVTEGLLWQVIGESGDSTLAERFSNDEELIQSHFPDKRIVLSTASSLPFVGPRAAILEGILAQNFGCSQVFLRSENGAIVRDGFALFAPGELAIVPLVFAATTSRANA
jgi:adenylyl-sulfate kinase